MKARRPPANSPETKISACSSTTTTTTARSGNVQQDTSIRSMVTGWRRWCGRMTFHVITDMKIPAATPPEATHTRQPARLLADGVMVSPSKAAPKPQINPSTPAEYKADSSSTPSIESPAAYATRDNSGSNSSGRVMQVEVACSSLIATWVIAATPSLAERTACLRLPLTLEMATTALCPSVVACCRGSVLGCGSMARVEIRLVSEWVEMRKEDERAEMCQLDKGALCLSAFAASALRLVSRAFFTPA